MSEPVYKIYIGTDPEFFMKRISDGKFISAVPHIKGDKFEPVELPKSEGNIQHDNVAVEFSTKPGPGSMFANIMKATLAEVITHLPEGHELDTTPSAVFDKDQLDTPEAQEFGCTPDYCAWKKAQNSSPTHSNPAFRSCGGHVHVGALNEKGELIHKDAEFLLDFSGKMLMVRGMDLFHGIISTILDSSPEAIERRKLYGKAGCHRPTDYGVEYRTLSNYWTKSPHLSMLIAALTEDVLELIVAGKLEDLIEVVGRDEIQNIINTGDVASAEDVLAKHLEEHLSGDAKDFLAESRTQLNVKVSIKTAWALA